MATVNFSVPDEVKEIFNMAFSGVNRSAVVSELMRTAAEHELRLKQRRQAVDIVLAERKTTMPVQCVARDEALQELRR